MDPANYLSAPSLAVEMCLLNTRIKISLMQRIDRLNMMERMMRGGLCFVGSQRYVKANNKYVPDHNPNEQTFSFFTKMPII